MSWHIVLSDNRGNALGELLEAHERRLRFTLNRPPTVGFTARAQDELAPYLVQDDLTVVKAYVTLPPAAPVIRVCGPIINHDKARTAGGGTIAVLAAGAGWRLGYRLIGKADTGCTLTPAAGAASGDLARIIVNAVNQGDSTSVFASAGDTGIRTPAGPITAGNPNPVGPWYYKFALEAIGDLSSVLDGFDWRVDPTEPTPDALGVQLGTLNIATVLGQVQPDAVFEFGTGRSNVTEFHELSDAGLLCNLAYNLPPGFPGAQTSPVVSASDATSIAQHGLYEAMVAGDLTVDAFRQELVNENVQVRSRPPKTYRITPIPDQGDGSVPKFGVDYDLGDVLPFRAVETFEIRDSSGKVIGWREDKTIDGWFRIYQVDLAINDQGVEAPTLTILQTDVTDPIFTLTR